MPIDEPVVAYEHEAPLQDTTLGDVREGDVREQCRRGLDASSGVIGWDIPELRILVAGELAVTWDLNRLTAEQPDGTTTEMWSRGTRVSRRRDGASTMAHRHVSFPLDSETGAARIDLRP